MSKANSAGKVLRTAIKRLEKRWGKGAWSSKGDDGTFYVCLEGSVTGGCKLPLTDAQKDALHLMREVIAEKYPKYAHDPEMGWFLAQTAERKGERPEPASIPNFNDDEERTLEEVVEVAKLALIRWETGGLDPEDAYIDPDEVDDILSGAMPD